MQKTYQVTLDTLKHVGNVVDSLYKKANKLA
jgi:26S proteasome regulatory subunit N6